MAGTKTITTYDGVKYQIVTLEEIGNTGHYKEISRSTNSILGLLDDVQELERAKKNINNFRLQNGTMYILTDSVVTGLNAKYYSIFTSIAVHYPKDYDSLADGVIKAIEELGYVQAIEYKDKEIIFTLISKKDEKELTIYLRPIVNDMKVVGG